MASFEFWKIMQKVLAIQNNWWHFSVLMMDHYYEAKYDFIHKTLKNIFKAAIVINSGADKIIIIKLTFNLSKVKSLESLLVWDINNSISYEWWEDILIFQRNTFINHLQCKLCYDLFHKPNSLYIIISLVTSCQQILNCSNKRSFVTVLILSILPASANRMVAEEINCITRFFLFSLSCSLLHTTMVCA